MRQNPHVRICGGPGSATTLVYPTCRWDKVEKDTAPQELHGWSAAALSSARVPPKIPVRL